MKYFQYNNFVNTFNGLKDKSIFNKKELNLINKLVEYNAKLCAASNINIPYAIECYNLKKLFKQFIPEAKVYTAIKNKHALIYECNYPREGYYGIVRLSFDDRRSASYYPMSSTLLVSEEIMDIEESDEYCTKNIILNNICSLKSIDEVKEYAGLYFKLKVITDIKHIKENIDESNAKIISWKLRLEKLIKTLNSLK